MVEMDKGAASENVLPALGLHDNPLRTSYETVRVLVKQGPDSKAVFASIDGLKLLTEAKTYAQQRIASEQGSRTQAANLLEKLRNHDGVTAKPDDHTVEEARQSIAENIEAARLAIALLTKLQNEAAKQLTESANRSTTMASRVAGSGRG